ncbi:MAG: hypothetical protein EOO15_10280 [Chitinophagaceae bacterium]|nr:MAG: hypothetical protein EOO15_10280 [Chitinophagaceae bacterium]
MTLMNRFTILCLMASLTWCTGHAQKTQAIPERLRPLPFGSVRPLGWLKEQIEDNLAGYTGHLDSLVPELIVKDDIYGRDRLTPKVKSKDVGAVGAPGEWQVQFLWWNSETQSNWWDGYIRSSLLAGDAKHRARVAAYVRRILATQDKDGYLGIYAPDLRYRFTNENGELWAKATLLRGLIAWYDATGETPVLTAVVRAVDNTMRNWPINKSHPFHSTNPNVGGLSHGLMFSDVLESLYRITGDKRYRDYLVFCYREFSDAVINEDAQLPKLLNTSLALKGHGVHTYEHLRTVAAAYYFSGDTTLQRALTNFLQKIQLTTTASGGPVGDEWIGGRPADATNRGYEYCSLQELLHSYSELLVKSGAASWGDEVERLFFNAAQGARHPHESSIAYLKSDNSYQMTGGLNGDTSDKHQVRYKYSPVHQDAAVCCVPNAGRIAPYYTQYMWAIDDKGLVATLLGPSRVRAKFNGRLVTVEEQTSYPYNYNTTFVVQGASPSFVLRIRKPSWATAFTVGVPYTEKDGYIVIKRRWKQRETLHLNWTSEVRNHVDRNGEHYYSYGPLLLAHPIAATDSTSKAYSLPGFRDVRYRAKESTRYRFAGADVEGPLNGKLQFRAKALNPATGETESILLEPMGGTLLRQVTFKQP